MGKIPTKIPQLDLLLKGGLDEGKLSLIWASPGLDSSALGNQIASAVSKSKSVFYIVNSKNPASLGEVAKEFGFAMSKITVIDSYSGIIGQKSASKLSIANPKDLQEILDDITLLTKKVTNPFIVIDSLSTLIDITNQENSKMLVALKKLKATILCLFTEWPYKAAVLKDLRATADTIIELNAIQKNLLSWQYFSVTKLGAKKCIPQAIPYTLVKPGGLKIYIPKILVTGPFNAGKTSFIHSCSQKAVSVDRLGTTIALDHGHMTYKNFKVDLFGTPGQQRFDPILKLLGGEAMGVIVVVSSTDPQGLPRAMEMMKKAQVQGLPVVVVANKANLRGSMKPEQIKEKMGVKNVEVVPVTAKDLTKVQPGLPCQLNHNDLIKVLDALFGKLIKTS